MNVSHKVSKMGGKIDPTITRTALASLLLLYQFINSNVVASETLEDAMSFAQRVFRTPASVPIGINMIIAIRGSTNNDLRLRSFFRSNTVCQFISSGPGAGWIWKDVPREVILHCAAQAAAY